MLYRLYHENEYKSCSFLPNTNPRCPQLLVLLPIVFLIQTDVDVEDQRGSNLNKCCPVHEEEVS